MEAADHEDPGLRNRAGRMGGGTQRISTQPGALVQMGLEQPGHSATTRCRFVG